MQHADGHGHQAVPLIASLGAIERNEPMRSEDVDAPQGYPLLSPPKTHLQHGSETSEAVNLQGRNSSGL